MSTIVPTTITRSIAAATIPINVMVHSSRLSPDDRHDPILRGGGVGGNRAYRCPIGMRAPGRACARPGFSPRWSQAFLTERIAEPARLLGRQVETERIDPGPPQLGQEAVRSRAGAEDEERGRPRDHEVADALHEIVLDAEARQASGERPGGGAEGRPRDRDQEHQPEKDAPEPAPEGAWTDQAAERAQRRLALGLRPRHECGVIDFDRPF